MVVNAEYCTGIIGGGLWIADINTYMSNYKFTLRSSAKHAHMHGEGRCSTDCWRHMGITIMYNVLFANIQVVKHSYDGRCYKLSQNQ